MAKISRADLNSFIKDNIQSFHQKRLESLKALKLKDILKRKNPYLFKAKNVAIAKDLVQQILDAHLSSQEEGIFGGFLEQLAIFVAAKVCRGKKSGIEGIDLELTKGGVEYIISIKSGPNWGNSQQIRRMVDNFKKAKRIKGTNTSSSKVVGINGCCYGIDDNPDKIEYIKLCGQRFWEFITYEPGFYKEIIEPLGYKAKEKNQAFREGYAKVINKFTKDFTIEYCFTDGGINWEKLIEFNSGKKKNTEFKV